MWLYGPRHCSYQAFPECRLPPSVEVPEKGQQAVLEAERERWERDELPERRT